jgi:2-polyprenyl-3-methyl-5-hydroxy-6-metoxy-1,4-benzoquinol methylase
MNTSPARQPAICKHPEWKDHWEHLYAAKGPAEVNWHHVHPQHSLSLIADTGIGTAASIIDIGGGASTLVDHLLQAGYCDITVLDIARTAIQRAQLRLGDRSQQVTWIEGDVTDCSPARKFDIWHDRAVFHFLTNELDRNSYLEALHHSLKPGGQAIIATFSDSGPSRCSGLDIMRYSPETLSQALGPQSLHLVETLTEEHRTTNGGLQQFVYCRFQHN